MIEGHPNLPREKERHIDKVCAVELRGEVQWIVKHSTSSMSDQNTPIPDTSNLFCRRFEPSKHGILGLWPN